MWATRAPILGCAFCSAAFPGVGRAPGAAQLPGSGREVPRQPRRKCSCSAAEAGRNDLTTGCDQKLRDVLCPFCGAGSCDQRTEEPQLPVSCCFPSRYLQEHLADVWNGENCVSPPPRLISLLAQGFGDAARTWPHCRSRERAGEL